MHLYYISIITESNHHFELYVVEFLIKMLSEFNMFEFFPSSVQFFRPKKKPNQSIKWKRFINHNHIIITIIIFIIFITIVVKLRTNFQTKKRKWDKRKIQFTLSLGKKKIFNKDHNYDDDDDDDTCWSLVAFFFGSFVIGLWNDFIVIDNNGRKYIV